DAHVLGGVLDRIGGQFPLDIRCRQAGVHLGARRQPDKFIGIAYSLRCGGLGVRTQPLLLPRADRPAAALVPSTSHGAARIVIELRNKHTLTGKHAAFRSYLCSQLGGDFLSQRLTSKGLCRRIHFRRMPSVNDGPSDMPDSGFAATSLLAGSPTSRITCSAASRSASTFSAASPPSSRSWQLLALPPWPLRARPCGRLHAPPSPPPRRVNANTVATSVAPATSQSS